MADGSSSQVKRGRKFDQVLSGARDVFLRDGFEGASVDDIARASNVSKATLYSYFPDKALLFMEVAKTECQRQANTAMAILDLEQSIDKILRDVGMHLVRFVSSDFGMRIFRICVAESDRFPQLGREFYESGPELVRARMIELLKAGVARGELVIDDIALAADQFPELCKADLSPRMVFQHETSFTEAEIARVVDGAVATFMARYGA